MNPLELNRFLMTDALIYGLEVDSRDDSVTLAIGVDSDYHKELCGVVGVYGAGSIVVDFQFKNVRSLTVRGMLAKVGDWADDEPPHDYEIAKWVVKRPLLRRTQYRLDIRCFNSPRCSVVFEEVSLRKSARKPGVIHDYDREAAGGATG